jgi:hypothetical protein
VEFSKEKKKEMIHKFINEEFYENIAISIFQIFNSSIEEGKNCKEEINQEINKVEKKILKDIGLSINNLGKIKGVQKLIDDFIHFKHKYLYELNNCLFYTIKELDNQIKNKVDEIFIYLKKHELGYIFNFTIKDFDELLKYVLSHDFDYLIIKASTADIKLDFPVDTKNKSEENVKNKYYDFNKKYFETIRNYINKIYFKYEDLLDTKRAKLYDYLMFILIRPRLDKKLKELG